jgi:fluoride exporter
MSGVLVWVGVGLLGGCGALARVAVGAAVAKRIRTDFPIGTLAVNLSGSALLGLLAGIELTGDGRLLAGTAVLGSYTTFSTWMLESQRLAAYGRWRAFALNVLGSLLLGVTAIVLGRAIGRVL